MQEFTGEGETGSARERDVALALWLSVFTVGWNVVFGGLAIAVATQVGSSSLLGFGLDAIVDATASVILVWRFSIEGKDEERAQRIEAMALRAVGIALVCAGAYVSFRSISALMEGSGPETSTFGLILAAASAVVLPFLAIGKYRIAKRLQSHALRADSILTAAAGMLAIISLAASALDTVGLWWADPAAALLIASVLFLEGGRSILRPPEGR
jgi:divalent metal cation (Fe/Co/Zn/Cd) transporter